MKFTPRKKSSEFTKFFFLKMFQISYSNIKFVFLGAFFTLASAAQDDGSLLRVAKQAHRKGLVNFSFVFKVIYAKSNFKKKILI